MHVFFFFFFFLLLGHQLPNLAPHLIHLLGYLIDDLLLVIDDLLLVLDGLQGDDAQLAVVDGEVTGGLVLAHELGEDLPDFLGDEADVHVGVGGEGQLLVLLPAVLDGPHLLDLLQDLLLLQRRHVALEPGIRGRDHVCRRHRASELQVAVLVERHGVGARLAPEVGHIPGAVADDKELLIGSERGQSDGGTLRVDLVTSSKDGRVVGRGHHLSADGHSPAVVHHCAHTNGHTTLCVCVYIQKNKCIMSILECVCVRVQCGVLIDTYLYCSQER